MEPHHKESTKKADALPRGTGNGSMGLQTKNARPDYAIGKMAVRVVLAYVIVAALWILISDPVLAALVSDHDLLMRLEVVKGWAFVAVTAALLFFLMRRETRHWSAERAARDAAEGALRDSETRFRRLFELAPLPLGFYRLDGVAMYFNRRFEQVLGYTAEDIPTLQHWQQRAHPNEAERREAVTQWEAAVARAIKSNADIEPVEFKLSSKDGEVGTFLVSGALMSDGVLAVFVDVTERSRHEAALRESEARYRLLAEHMADVIWVIDVNTQRHLYVSPSVERLRGYTPEEVLGHTVEQCVTPASFARIQKIMPERMAAFFAGDGSVVTQIHEVEQTCKDGSTVWTEVSTTLVKTPSGEIQLLGVSRDISERRRMEDKLRRQEFLLRETTELAHIGGWEFDPATMEGTWTEETARIHDLDPTEKTSATKGLSFFAGPSRAKIEAAVGEAMAHGTPYDLELELTTATGRSKWVRTIAHPVIENGKIVRIRGTFQDISARRRAEAFSEGQKLLLEMIANGAPLRETLVTLTRLIEAQCEGMVCAVSLLDPEGIHLRVAASPGLPTAYVSAIDGGAIGPAAGSCGTAAFRQEPVYVENIETDPLWIDSRTVALAHGLRACWATPIFGDGHVIFGVFAAYFRFPRKPDAQSLHLIELVTHTAAIAINRHRGESALRESEERFRQVVENLDEVFWMFEPSKNKMLYVSPAYKKIWQRDSDKLYVSLENWGDAIHPEDRQRVVEAATKKRATGEYAETYRILRPDGEVRWIHDRAFPVRDEAGRVYRVVGTATDITERRILEEQFRQAQKMEAIGTLAGGIAHDFNNILGAIVGFAELAKLEEPIARRSQDCLDEILRACKRAGDLVRQILAFSRRQETKRRPVQLWSVVDEATKLLRAALPSTVQFDLELSTDAPTVLADPSQIHQVILNLCTNAAQAMKERTGRLGVKLERFVADEEFVKLHQGSRPGVYTRLTISDDGHGMDQATVDRIYEPFFTTKAPGEGTGLGLSVVHGIVQSHDGIITVFSQPGKGTVFCLYFPERASDSAEPGLQSDSIPRGRGQRILVVDDEALLAQMTERILKRLDYVGETATDPEAALEFIRAEPTKYALVLTDLTMPGMTGVEFATRALKLRPQLPVILLTGFFANMTPSQFRAIGIKEVLMKPITIRNLGEAIDRVLKQPRSS